MQPHHRGHAPHRARRGLRPADVLVVVSPHTPRTPDDWRLVCNPAGQERLKVNFGEFDFPKVRFEVEPAYEARDRLARLAPKHGLHTEAYEPERIDQGAAVPLWFLREAGWVGPTLVVGLPWREGTEAVMGEAIRQVSGSEQWAVVASGDMSHRLRPDSPAGFDPRGEEFDHQVVHALKAGDLRAVAEIDPDLRKRVAEDVVAPVTVAAGASRWRADNAKVVWYESPYGVGYCVSLLFAHAVSKSAAPERTPARASPASTSGRRR
ncbi:MAG: class III extradiol dioxygenase subunit B-like domain-containing protein [Myxococcota bacterium]